MRGATICLVRSLPTFHSNLHKWPTLTCIAWAIFSLVFTLVPGDAAFNESNLAAASTLAWVREHLLLSQIVMAFNAACQLYFVFYSLDPSGKYAINRRNGLTHLVAKSNAGVSVLYMWKAWGALEIGVGPFH